MINTIVVVIIYRYFKNHNFETTVTAVLVGTQTLI